MIILTETGKKTIKWYIEELKAHRKEILDAGKDTADDTRIPTEEDIIADIEMTGVDRNGTYCNGWGVTDTYDHEPLILRKGKDFIHKVTDIDWDIDGEEVDLPSEVEIPANVSEEEIADTLSDMFGFCVKSFAV